jgi:hypothetical protein
MAIKKGVKKPAAKKAAVKKKSYGWGFEGDASIMGLGLSSQEAAYENAMDELEGNDGVYRHSGNVLIFEIIKEYTTSFSSVTLKEIK